MHFESIHVSVIPPSNVLPLTDYGDKMLQMSLLPSIASEEFSALSSFALLVPHYHYSAIITIVLLFYPLQMDLICGYGI